MNTLFNNNSWVKTFLKVLTLFFCCCWFIYNFSKSDIPADAGDGIMHYYISNASWQNPSLFLDHWGKPLFILLSSPFSQFGFAGIVFFNIVVFVSTVLIAWRIAIRLEINFVFQLIFPLVLINIQDYSLTVLGGLTEPLFNLFFITSFWLLLSKRWIALSILVSFLPFLRSEGQLPVILIGIIFLYLKQYKAIPFLFIGIIIYSIIGFFVFGDLAWYFTHNPYHLNNSIYNHGSWNHYLLSYKNYLGNPGLFLFIPSFIFIIYSIFKNKLIELDLMILFYVYGTYFTILFLHSYFWATGTNASMGLTRIATQAMPTFILINLYFLSKSSFFSNKLLHYLITGIFLILVVSSITTKHFPLRANSFERSILQSASFIKKINTKHHSLFYHHPLFCFAMDENPYLKNQMCKFFYSKDFSKELRTIIKSGDYIIWDSQFGPREQGLPLELLASQSKLSFIKQFGSQSNNLIKIYRLK